MNTKTKTTGKPILDALIDASEALDASAPADKSAHTPTADEYVCWQHKGWCKGQRTRKAIDCDCFDEAGQTFYSHHTQQEHEESGCTDYLQHNADSCPHLTTPPPWKAFKYPDCKTWTVAARQSVASKIQREANARLIAAAPDLLAALKHVAEVADGYGGDIKILLGEILDPRIASRMLRNNGVVVDVEAQDFNLRK